MKSIWSVRNLPPQATASYFATALGRPCRKQIKNKKNVDNTVGNRKNGHVFEGGKGVIRWTSRLEHRRYRCFYSDIKYGRKYSVFIRLNNTQQSLLRYIVDFTGESYNTPGLKLNKKKKSIRNVVFVTLNCLIIVTPLLNFSIVLVFLLVHRQK